MLNRPTWRPVIEDELRTPALTLLHELADVAAEAPTEDVLPPELAARALFLDYLERCGLGKGRAGRVNGLLDVAITRFGEVKLPIWLHGGLLEVAWIAEQLVGEGVNTEVDRVVLDYVEPKEWPHCYDLLRGLVGIGLYGLEASSREEGRLIVERVVRRLEESAETTDRGITWWTAPDEERRVEEDPTYKGGYDVGVAHGVPAVIGFLARASINDCGGAAARSILARATAWLLSCRRKGMESNFPFAEGNGRHQSNVRTAWCYGDPGIAVILEAVGRSVGDNDLREIGIQVGLDAAGRPAERCFVADAPFCHGASGLVQLYGRLFSATGDARFRHAANHWLRAMLSMRVPNEGVCGYRSWRPGKNAHWTTEGFTLLNGAGGIGLALAACMSDVEPNWDRLFMCSL